MKNWLTKKITLEELETAMVANENPKIKTNILSFAPLDNIRNNDKWKEIKSSLKAGDEIWEFCSPADSWAKSMGSTGICIVRNGEVIMDIVTMMN